MHIGLHQSFDLHEEKLPDKKEPNAMYYGEEKTSSLVIVMRVQVVG